MTAGDMILMPLLRSKLEGCSCRGHGAAVEEAPRSQLASDPRRCGLQLKPKSYLLLVPLRMAQTPGNAWSDCACDLTWCQAVHASDQLHMYAQFGLESWWGCGANTPR